MYTSVHASFVYRHASTVVKVLEDTVGLEVNFDALCGSRVPVKLLMGPSRSGLGGLGVSSGLAGKEQAREALSRKLNSWTTALNTRAIKDAAGVCHNCVA